MQLAITPAKRVVHKPPFLSLKCLFSAINPALLSIDTTGAAGCDVVATADIAIDQADTKNKWRNLASMKLYCAWMLYVPLGVVMLGFDWSCYPGLLAMPTFAKKYARWYPAQKLYARDSLAFCFFRVH